MDGTLLAARAYSGGKAGTHRRSGFLAEYGFECGAQSELHVLGQWSEELGWRGILYFNIIGCFKNSINLLFQYLNTVCNEGATLHTP